MASSWQEDHGVTWSEGVTRSCLGALRFRLLVHLLQSISSEMTDLGILIAASVESDSSSRPVRNTGGHGLLKLGHFPGLLIPPLWLFSLTLASGPRGLGAPCHILQRSRQAPARPQLVVLTFVH